MFTMTRSSQTKVSCKSSFYQLFMNIMPIDGWHNQICRPAALCFFRQWIRILHELSQGLRKPSLKHFTFLHLVLDDESALRRSSILSFAGMSGDRILWETRHRRCILLGRVAGRSFSKSVFPWVT